MRQNLGENSVLVCSSAPADDASAWVQRFASLIPEGGRVLDLACGYGRHARLLAGLGFQVEALDRDPEALAALADCPGVTVRQADIEGGPWPYYAEVFDAVVVTNYLWRPLLPQIVKVVEQGGVLIYETFMVGNEQFGKPSNPAFLLRTNELLDLVRNRMRIVAFEQGQVRHPRLAMMQRICAVRANSGALEK
ncbi:MAG: class I SAM-dependent methyltransferase [Rhodocyclaceae bacterium]|nr:class I SAM-dependent methyltransferase [Rhodocyclaceae bacterium]